MKIDGELFETLLWAEGIETRLVEVDEDRTLVDIPEHHLRIGYAWNDLDSENSPWSFDVGDIDIFFRDSFYGQSDAESAVDLVEEILNLLDS